MGEQKVPDNQQSEVFSSQGSRGSVVVTERQAALPLNDQQVRFVAASGDKKLMSIDFKQDPFADCEALAKRQPPVVKKPLYQGIFRERISKVKKVTVDIYRALSLIKFIEEPDEPDEPEIVDLL